MNDNERIHGIVEGLVSELSIGNHEKDECEFCRLTTILQKEQEIQKVIRQHMMSMLNASNNPASTLGNCILLGFVIGQRFAESKALESMYE